MFWKKKVKCEHDYFHLDTVDAWEDHCVGNIVVSYKDVKHSYIYCPKCDQRRTVKEDEWLRIEKAQEIKKRY